MQYIALMQKHAKQRPKKQGPFFPPCSGISLHIKASPKRRSTLKATSTTLVRSTHINPLHADAPLHNVSEHFLNQTKMFPRGFIYVVLHFTHTVICSTDTNFKIVHSSEAAARVFLDEEMLPE